MSIARQIRASGRRDGRGGVFAKVVDRGVEVRRGRMVVLIGHGAHG